MPQVSICLPNLNTAPFLKERLDSIQDQTFLDWECVVSDNFSNDGAWDHFVAAAATDKRFKIKQEPRDSNGMYPNWNHCLNRVTGEFVYIATSDDTMRPNYLVKCVRMLERHPESAVVVCDFDEIDQKGEVNTKEDSWHRRYYGSTMLEAGIRGSLSEFIATLALGTPWFTITSVLFRRRLLEKTGLFPTSFGSHGDNLWTARAALAGDVVYVPERLATFRRHETQATAKLVTPNLAWKVVTGFQQLLDEVAPDLPDSWTRLPNWQERLLSIRLNMFRDSLKLERWRMRQDPAGFLRSLFAAWRTQRGWLLRQAAKGFPSEPEFDPVSSALALSSEFLSLAKVSRFRPLSPLTA